MNILLVAATISEIKPFSDGFNYRENEIISLNSKKIEILITGVGMVATSYALTKALRNKKYDLVINAGIAGAFDRKLKTGEVVEVVSEQFSELGAEDGEKFIHAFDMGLIDGREFPYINNKILQPYRNISGLKEVKSITVNKVHGDEGSIKKTLGQFKPQIETMEGAAVFYVCLLEGVRFVQIRAISNYVEQRNKNNWNVPLAIEQLNVHLQNMMVRI